MMPELDDDDLEVEERLKRGLLRRPLSLELRQRLASPQAKASAPRRPAWRGHVLNACAAVILAVLVGLVLLPVGKLPESFTARSSAEDPQNPTDKKKDEPEPTVTTTLPIKDIIDGVASGKLKYTLFPELEPWMSRQKEPDLKANDVAARVAEIVHAMLGSKVVVSKDGAVLSVTDTRENCKAAETLLRAVSGENPSDQKTIVNCECRVISGTDKEIKQLLNGADPCCAQQLLLPTATVAKTLKTLRSLKMIEPRMTAYPGQGATIAVTHEQSYLADYNIDGDTYDPVIKNVTLGSRVFVRSWILPGNKVRVSTTAGLCELLSLETVQLDATAVGEKNKAQSRISLPLQLPNLRMCRVPLTTSDMSPDQTLAICVPRERATVTTVRDDKAPRKKDEANEKKEMAMHLQPLVLLINARAVRLDDETKP